jgi:hypothetical protein
MHANEHTILWQRLGAVVVAAAAAWRWQRGGGSGSAAVAVTAGAQHCDGGCGGIGSTAAVA